MGLPVHLALNQSPGMRGSGARGLVAFGGAAAGSCRRLQPEAPALAAKRSLRADKHFLLPRLGGLGGDVVVSSSCKSKAGSHPALQGSSMEPRASLQGRTSCGPAASANTGGMAGTSRQVWESSPAVSDAQPWFGAHSLMEVLLCLL